MSRLILVVHLFLCITVFSNAQGTYYWYNNKKVHLGIVPNKKFMILDTIYNEDTLTLLNSYQKLLHRSSFRFESKSSYYGASCTNEIFYLLVDNENNKNEHQVNNANIVYETPFFQLEGGKEFGISHLFYVELKQGSDITNLELIAKEQKVTILGNNEFMPLWFTLACNRNSKGNALEMANYFYETGLFYASEPDFINMSDDNTNAKISENYSYYNNYETVLDNCYSLKSAGLPLGG